MRRELSGGLILRSLSEGHATDCERLPQYYVDVFAGEGNDSQEEQITAQWASDLIECHPIVTHDDLFVVVDPAKDDMIVSATVFIPQVWRYDDIEIAVGRPELVATTKEYRRRGLIRAQFEAMHERSAALGQNVLGITGNPYFYRQFGYAMAVELEQQASLNTGLIKKPDNVRFTLRLATESDIPDLMGYDRFFARERLMSVVYDEPIWRYEISSKRRAHPWYTPPFVIVNEAGENVGYVTLRDNNWHQRIGCMAYVVGEKSSYLETFNDVIYGIKQWAIERFEVCPPRLDFETGIHDTLCTLIDRTIAGVVYSREETWYMRIVDLPRFIRDIAPVLERRLEGSGAHRYTGTLAVGFYNYTGITIHFENGRIKDVVGGALDEHDADISFPGLSFLNVVFGYQTIDEVRVGLPEVLAKPKAAVLLSILFPRKRSWLIPVS